MPSRFRPATAADVPFIVEIWHEGWHDAHGDSFPPDIVAMRTRESLGMRLAPLLSDSFVADDDGVPIAFGTLKENEIDQFYVARSRRGTGLAKVFLNVLEGELGRRGIVDALIQCAAGNCRGRAFYAKCGWADTGVRDLPIWMPDARLVTQPVHLFAKRLV